MKEVIRRIQTIKSPYILFLPFLILYVFLILIFSESEFVGDESRFIMFAQNLTNGFYSPAPPATDLGNSPGYPLILMPFVALNIPLIFIKLLNAVFYYFSIVFIFKALSQIVSYKFSIVFSFLWAIYPTFYEIMIYIFTDVFAVFLLSIFLLNTLKIFKNNFNKKYIIYSGLTLGYLILTKPIFGYVLLCMVAGILLLLLFNRKNQNHHKSLAVLIIAFLINIPYLAYTYQLSGKMFYWSSFGGNNLYWMSSPFESEYGDWMGFPAESDDIHRIEGSEKIINSNHQKDFDELLSNKEVQKANINSNGYIEYNLTKGFVQDDLFKQIAIKNIKSKPIKYIQNCISNIGRMIFNYPVSYVPQKPSTLSRLPINGILLVVTLFCLIPTLINWKSILYPIRFLLFFIIIYFGGSILGSADIRMFLLVVPVLLFWIAYILSKSIQVRLNWNQKEIDNKGKNP